MPRDLDPLLPLLVAIAGLACHPETSDKPSPSTSPTDTGVEAEAEDTDPEPPAAEDCDEPGDEDGDGLADCLDPDCDDPCPEDCANGSDDDGDALVDCDDPDCDCPEDCDNGADDDRDALVDCDDPDCARECGEDCADGEDNDLDGLTDCEDADCVGVEGCIELCAPGSGDEDLDGWLDCADDDCWGTEACDGQTVWIESGTVDKHLRSWRRSSGYIAAGTSGRWTWRTTQATFSQDVTVTSVLGRARLQGASGSQTCTFGFDRAWFHRDEETVAPGAMVPLTERTGFFSSGACDLSSAVLATGVKFVAGGVLAYGSSTDRSGWWYHGPQSLVDQVTGGVEEHDWRSQSRTSTWHVPLEPGQPLVRPLP